MHPVEAYRRQQNHSMPRIELILALYRKALENLTRARQALSEQQPDAARPFLLKTQLMVSTLAAELPAYQDATAPNFLRLYEFVVRQVAAGTVESIDAATRVLQPLLEGFEAVREQALLSEAQGQIPPLDRARQVSLTA